MDSGLILIAVVTGAVVAATVLWIRYSPYVSPDTSIALGEAVARLRAHLSKNDSEAIIRLFAAELYDTFAPGSLKVSQEFFIEYCVRVILGAQAMGDTDAETFGVVGSKAVS